MRAFFLALTLIVLGAVPAAAGPWRITSDHWSEADEDGFGRFVTAIGDSGCSSSESCLRSSANPWAQNEDRAFLDVDVDCAKLPYLLRAYYAWKKGLPFSYVDAVSGAGDLRFSHTPNVPVSRTAILDHGGGIDGAEGDAGTAGHGLYRDLPHRCRSDARRAVGFLFPRHSARQHPPRHGDL